MLKIITSMAKRKITEEDKASIADAVVEAINDAIADVESPAKEATAPAPAPVEKKREESGKFVGRVSRG